MNEWYKKVPVLWTIISVLFTGLIAMIALNLSYDPEISRLRAENIEQEKELIRLKGYKDQHTDELNNVYDLFYDYNLRIKTLEDRSDDEN